LGGQGRLLGYRLSFAKASVELFSVIMADKTLLTMAVILMTGSLLIMATF
jgi:hypothetical protein